MPETRYALSGSVAIAYQVVGSGPTDLVLVPGMVSHVEQHWEHPAFARFLDRLASFCRLIVFDKRGTGMSERLLGAGGAPTLEERMDDVRAVLDAAGSERAVLLGASEGGPMSVLFAATYPERTRALVLCGAYARQHAAPDYPWGSPAPSEADFERRALELPQQWASGKWVEGVLRRYHPDGADDAQFRRWFTTVMRYGGSPGAVLALARMNAGLDVRHVLPAVRVPTLVVHRTGDRVAPVEGGRYLAARIPGARLAELAGTSHFAFVGDADAVLAEVEEFLTGARPAAAPDRVLATVLFVDVVGSTERAVGLGDRRWADLLGAFYALVRRELGRFRGREVDTAGDGLLATFDGPARAVRCACAVTAAVGGLGLQVRAGLHTGEVEVVGDAVRGIAVHIGARVAALAQAGEVLVSSTVRDLVAGSGIRFADRGPHALKGVEEPWRLLAVEAV